jgi:hypothetical protein
MRRNGGLVSYLFITASRCASSPLASIAPESSSIANNAGLHSAPFGVEDIGKGKWYPFCVRKDVTRKRVLR